MYRTGDEAVDRPIEVVQQLYAAGEVPSAARAARVLVAALDRRAAADAQAGFRELEERRFADAPDELYARRLRRRVNASRAITAGSRTVEEPTRLDSLGNLTRGGVIVAPPANPVAVGLVPNPLLVGDVFMTFLRRFVADTEVSDWPAALESFNAMAAIVEDKAGMGEVFADAA
jgi:hypothetical protein